MRVPIGWLAEYVDVPAGTSVEELDTAFVRLGLEVEEIHQPEPVTGPLVIGKVLEIEELTGFKKPIRYTQVDVGEAAPRGIVCGATNFVVGDTVVVALPGAVLPGGFAIAARTTYDHVSDGMICSVRELGVGDDHAGILVLGHEGADVPPPGTPAGPVVGLEDVVIELAVTPDRGYCLSMRGIAREMGTGLAAPWRDPGALTPPAWSGEPAWKVTVADPDRCDRFSMIAMEGLDPTAPSPWWLRRRLAQASVRSISLAVDVTNYVMLELGQPMHAFDRDAVSGPITVRRARAGEKLTTLDGTSRTLDADDLLITDDSGPIGLAAVMGGATTEIGNGTSAVLLEAAHWEPTGVARTARRHRLPSEAAKRFERGVDPEMTVVALARAAELLAEYGGARVVGGLVDLDTRGPRPTIPLDAAKPARVAGVAYTAAQVVELLGAVGCDVDAGGNPLQVTPPPWRPDLTDPADLIEEVVRLAGYDDVPSVLPTAPPGRGLTDVQRRRRSVGRTLAEAGYVEAPNYPFIGTAALDALGLADDDERRTVVVVRNPLSEEEPALRTTLLPGLLATLGRNLSRGQRDVALFEHGAVFPGGNRTPAPLPGVTGRPDDATLSALLGAVPAQPWHVAVALAGHREPRGWWGPGRESTWADAVHAARLVAAASGVELTVQAGEQAPWHPGRCAELLVDGTSVGFAGELHPRVCAALELPPRTCAMELDLDALPAAEVPVGPPISGFPPVFLDLAFMVGDDVPTAAVDAAIRRGAGALLESLRLFDVYAGPQVGEGKQSLAYSLTLRAPDRTLSGEEAAAVRADVVAGVESAVGRSSVADLGGQVALVTGASTGIGRSLVDGLAARGMAVAGLARNEERLTRAMVEVAEATGVRTLAVAADVTDRAAVDAGVARVADELGRVDLLVNNAGVIDAAEVPVWEADPDQWWDVVASHVQGAHLLVRAVVPGMLARGHGRVVNLASGMSTRANRDYSAYSVAKTGLMRLTEALDLALQGSGVHAFDVAPGVVDTPMTRSMEMWRDFTDWTPPERVVELIAAIAAGELDAWAGRFVRAGKDDLDTLRSLTPEDAARQLRLTPYGDDDPLG